MVFADMDRNVAAIQFGNQVTSNSPAAPYLKYPVGRPILIGLGAQQSCGLVTRLGMALDYGQGRAGYYGNPHGSCPHSSDSFSPEPQMKTFLDLDSPTNSSFSFSADESVDEDSCDNDSLQSLPGSLVVATMEAAGAPVRLIGPASRDVSGSLLAASPSPSSCTTAETCSSYDSISKHKDRQSLLSTGNRQFWPPYKQDANAHSKNIEPPAPRRRTHKYQSSLKRLDQYLFERPSTQPANSQLQNEYGTNIVRDESSMSIDSMSEGRSPSVDSVPTALAMTKEQFDALPPTIQRKVSHVQT